MAGARLVLASASPRRSALLAAAGVELEVDAAGIAEHVPPGTPAARAAVDLARAKARAVAARRQSAGRDGELVLAADTVVVLGEGRAERLLGKPTDESHARAMLRELSGSRHRVITGVCALARGGGARREAEASGAETTWVTMRPIEPREIDAYAQSGEWQGKAGGYAIQERAERFVTRLEGGGLDNVVGLPLELALELLADAAARAGLAWSRPRA